MTNSWAILPHPTQAGQVGGHEGVGKVVKLGPGAETSTIKVGDRVGIKWISGTCGSCCKSLPLGVPYAAWGLASSAMHILEAFRGYR